ncbi:MAG TPA: bifunctional 4-hydroxy-2-oxoglutarate aldolase/2-dehydro-3-deoxy-phosphogluconate aldolase [Rhizomicrobium sp.]|jgi:2-dehydro-3-deoxyphosphogluconate aldolase/(4S)-4-hydroxy-2-oxoglutarate aldolase|nr:bifunctional 4-hydroxy-2-oxoglutarate aldolase/2-dehydro-3-deoxy-phosphogluconate aldolase [Rhizomicrobium sp.]
MAFDDTLRRTRIVPVIVIRDVAHAVPLARALVEGGLNILEITLRTPAALDAIKAIAAEVKDAVVGAGTVINAAQFAASAQAGARFVVSPGLTEEVVHASRQHNVPILPGVVTASDVMRGLGLGLSTFKFFPAESSGGAPAIKALGGPFPHVAFCPTGGVSAKNLGTYLSLPNVIAAGGSWMVPPDLDAADAFARAASLAREARTLADSVARA